jgi:hypothetical protein
LGRNFDLWRGAALALAEGGPGSCQLFFMVFINSVITIEFISSHLLT